MSTLSPISRKVTDSLLENRGYTKTREADYFREYECRDQDDKGITKLVLMNTGQYTVEHRLNGNSLKYVVNTSVVNSMLTGEQADLLLLIAQQLKAQHTLMQQMGNLISLAAERYEKDIVVCKEIIEC